MDKVVRDNSQQRTTWGGSGGVEEWEHTADKGCFCGMDRLGLQTATDGGFSTWCVEQGGTLANPCPAIVLGQEELYKKKLCQATLMKRLRLVTLPAACLK